MIEVSSPAFQSDGTIPAKYTCDGWGVSPPLSWSEIPDDTQSIAVLVEDPDAPGKPFLHWLMTDISPELHHLGEGGAPPRDARVAESDAGTASYYGPCPTHGNHHYHFRVFALDTKLGRRPESREDFLQAIAGHVLDEGELVGLYQRARA